MNFLFALLSFIKRHKILVFVVIPSCIFLLFSSYAAFVYVQWRSDRPLALDRLAKYKQLIDRTEDINRGLVYSASDIDVGKKVVEVPSRIYDRNGEIIGEYFNQKRELIPFNSIPKDIINAVVASEDRDFYKHKGINPKGIFRAVLKNVFSFSFSQGGSTVTQQLAKNFFTDMDKSIKEKYMKPFVHTKLKSFMIKMIYVDVSQSHSISETAPMGRIGFKNVFRKKRNRMQYSGMRDDSINYYKPA